MQKYDEITHIKYTIFTRKSDACPIKCHHNASVVGGCQDVAICLLIGFA